MNRRRFLALTAAALAAPGAASAAVREWRGQAMGADVTLRVRGAPPAQARAFFAGAMRELAHVESQFSLHSDSDLARLNRLGHLRFPSVAMQDLLALSDRLHRATGGAFDPTVQPLWLARARGGDEAAARALIGWRHVEWDAREIRLTRRGMALTLNGIAQGWAADRLAGVAARHGLTDLLIDSGEFRALGPRGWPLGIADAQGRVLHRLELRSRALATSSPLGTRIGPQDAPHIIDPAGGGAVWDTVSVSAPHAALADGLSTALCTLPRARIDAALAALPGCRVETLHPPQHGISADITNR
ncbi:FAD:protein FMN transferase [uncultured Paracoccus sp.]|uniref:FAD:protein FMN transferase n=1 Tax=uncultured Paracoccus sp. TaxID=189685 RepID=UPI0025EBFD14|nr:FAD:protein FMN transferase [uncultured Paracoccus sp.]